MPLSTLSIIDQFPSPIAALEGPDHKFVAASASYREFIGGVDPIGKTFAEVLPSLVEQGFRDRLDRVFRSGEADVLTGVSASWDSDGDGLPEDYFVDVIYHPLLVDEVVKGIVIEVNDVSARVRRERELAFLEAASEVLFSSLDYDATLSMVTRLAAESIADWCAVDEVAPDGTLRRIAVAHPDPAKVEMAIRLQHKYPADPDAPHGVHHVIRTGTSEYLSEIPDELLVRGAKDEEHLSLIRELGLRSYICVPLKARGHTLGALSLVSAESGRRYDARDVSFAEELASRAAIAVDNARLFSESEGSRVRAEEAAMELEAQAEELQSAQAELEIANDELQRANEELEARAREADEARRDAESSADRLERLQQVGGALAEVVTAERAAEVALEHAAELFGARTAVMACLSEDGRELQILHAIGLSEEIYSAFRSFPVDASIPLSDAVRKRQPVFLENEAERLSNYRELAEAYPATTGRAWASLPMIVEGRVLGGMSLAFPEAREFDADERLFLELVAQQSAQALERARLFEAERKSREEAENANRAKTEFLSAMSHELRTPLNAIAGYVDLLDLGIHGALTDSQRESLIRIKRNQEILLGLISDVLNFARVEAGRIEFASVPVPIEPLLQGLDEVLGPLVQTKNLTFRHTPNESGLVAVGDPDRIQQILLNLLSNAVKFTQPGGAISIDSDGTEDTVAIRVSDTGRGIPPDRLQSIFDPFVQVDRHRTDQSQQGVGLGLAISRELARGMGGDLEVESTEEEGSVFTVTLPRAR